VSGQQTRQMMDTFIEIVLFSAVGVIGGMWLGAAVVVIWLRSLHRSEVRRFEAWMRSRESAVISLARQRGTGCVAERWRN